MTNQWAVFESHVNLCKPQYKSTGVENYAEKLFIHFVTTAWCRNITELLRGIPFKVGAILAKIIC